MVVQDMWTAVPCVRRRWVRLPPVTGKIKVRLKDTKLKKGKSGRLPFEVRELRDPETRNAEFGGLRQMEKEESSVDDEWRKVEQGYVETCKKVLGQAKSNKEWISKET